MDARDSKLKIARANHHRDALERSIKAAQADGYFARTKPDPSHPKYALTIRRAWDIPDEWGLIIGEFAHNARSCLDVLVSAISTLSIADKKDRRAIQFPICDNLETFLESTKRQLKGVSFREIAIIEAFQPYNGLGKFSDDPIAILGDINNTDKHKLIPLVDVASKIESIGLGGNFPGFTTSGGPGFFPVSLSSGASVAFGECKIRILPHAEISTSETKIAEITAPSKGEMKMEPRISAEIQFGQGSERAQGRPVLGALTLILDRVKEIVRQFDPSVV